VAADAVADAERLATEDVETTILVEEEAMEMVPIEPIEEVLAAAEVEAATEEALPVMAPLAEVWPVMYAGAGVAFEVSTRLPSPQATAWPSGWVAFSGSVVVPSAPAIAKRVVQVKLEGATDVENW